MKTDHTTFHFAAMRFANRHRVVLIGSFLIPFFTISMFAQISWARYSLEAPNGGQWATVYDANRELAELEYNHRVWNANKMLEHMVKLGIPCGAVGLLLTIGLLQGLTAITAKS